MIRAKRSQFPHRTGEVVGGAINRTHRAKQTQFRGADRPGPGPIVQDEPNFRRGLEDGRRTCETNPFRTRPEESVGQAPPDRGHNCAKQTQFRPAGRWAGFLGGGIVRNKANSSIADWGTDFRWGHRLCETNPIGLPPWGRGGPFVQNKPNFQAGMGRRGANVRNKPYFG